MLVSSNFLPYVLCVRFICGFLVMFPHDGACHDKEPNVDKNNHHHWHNEGPDKLGTRIKKAARETNIEQIINFTKSSNLRFTVSIVMSCVCL